MVMSSSLGSGVYPASSNKECGSTHLSTGFVRQRALCPLPDGLSQRVFRPPVLQQEPRLHHNAFVDLALCTQQGAPPLEHNVLYRYYRAHCIFRSNGTQNAGSETCRSFQDRAGCSQWLRRSRFAERMLKMTKYTTSSLNCRFGRLTLFRARTLNAGYGADSGPSRGDSCRRAFRPKHAFIGVPQNRREGRTFAAPARSRTPGGRAARSARIGGGFRDQLAGARSRPVNEDGSTCVAKPPRRSVE